MRQVYIHGAFVPEQEARVSIKDRGFRFGDGVFETIAVHGGAPYQWALHMERLRAGLAALHMPADIADTLHAPCFALLARNGITDGLLRISVTRGEGSRGYLPTRETAPTAAIETVPFPPAPREPVRLWLSALRKIPAICLPVSCKTMQGLNATLARMEAEENGCFEALMLGTENQVCETSSGNIFWFSGGILCTPSAACGILPGTTRHAVLRLSPSPVREGRYALADILSAEEVFITNAAWGILPVTALLPPGSAWPEDGAWTRRLQDLLKSDIAHEAARNAALG